MLVFNKFLAQTFFWVFISLLVACKPSTQVVKHSLTDYKLLTKADAASVVVTDSLEHYFDMVTSLEMSLQMKAESLGGDRLQNLESYKKMLQEDAADFNASEAAYLKEVFKEALDLCAGISPNLKLPTILLVKTAGQYYGPGVFYTRQNAIVIPELQLNPNNKAGLLRTLVHEIFHIYSRYNKDKRDALYARIGYQRIASLELSAFLKDRILLNPDGVDVKYAIEVQDTAGRSFKGVPIIYSMFSKFQMMPFHKHFAFQLFEVQEQGGSWKVVNENTGYSEQDIRGYWEQIGKNTKYTIHPDEVLADNFAILAFSKKQPKKELSKLSEEGKKLLNDLEAILLK